MERPPRIDRYLVAAVVGAIALRIAYALPAHVAFADEPYYVWLAKNLFAGAGYNYHNGQADLHFPPLFPIALGLLQLVVRDWEWVTRVAYVIFGGLLPLPVYFLARQIHGQREARLAAFVIAISPALTAGILFAETLSEPLYLLCLFTAVQQAHRALITEELRPCLLAGVCFSLAHLTRPEAMVYFAASMVFLGAAYVARRTRPLGWTCRRCGLVLATFLVVSFPYSCYLHRQTGEWMLSNKGTTSYVTTRPLVRGDRIGFSSATDGLNEDGEIHFFARESRNVSLLRLLAGRYRRRIWGDVNENLRQMSGALIRPSFFGHALLYFAVLGVLGTPWSLGRLRDESFLAAQGGALVASMSIFFVKDRFLYGLLLPMSLWVACGLRAACDWIDRTELPRVLDRRWLRLAGKGGLLLAVAVWAVRNGRVHFDRQTESRDHVWPTVAWLKANLPPDALVLSNSPEVVFHAGLRWVDLPAAPIPQALRYGVDHHATHLAIQGPFLATSRPEQKHELLDLARDTEVLKLLVKVDEPEQDASFAVYEVRPGAREHLPILGLKQEAGPSKG